MTGAGIVLESDVGLEVEAPELDRNDSPYTLSVMRDEDEVEATEYADTVLASVG